MAEDFSFQNLVNAFPSQMQSTTPLIDGLQAPNSYAYPTIQVAGNDVHTIGPGPEYNKWDEALQAHGRIRIPKELDEPQKWLNQEHFKGILQNIDREDMPDGSVILSKKAFTS